MTPRNENPYIDNAEGEAGETLIKDEVLNVENFIGLFHLNKEGIKPEFVDILDQVPDEVASIMTGNLRDAMLFAQTSPQESVKQMYQEQVARAGANLEFFDNFCRNLCDVDQYAVAVEKERLGGIRIAMKPVNENTMWGELDGTDVREVEIVLRRGDNESSTTDTYTPMQLNFRFLDGEEDEIKSWRLDLHNTDRREIEVDAGIGGGIQYIKHEPLKALNATDDPEGNFRALQAAFMVNFGRLFLLGKDQEGKFVENGKAVYENPDDLKLVTLEYQKAVKLLKKD